MGYESELINMKLLASDLDGTLFFKHLEKGYKESDIEAIKKFQKEGNLFVIRPKEKLQIGKIEKNPEKLREIYELGRETVLPRIPEMKEFLKM